MKLIKRFSVFVLIVITMFLGDTHSKQMDSLDIGAGKLIYNMVNNFQLPRNYRKTNGPYHEDRLKEIGHVPTREGLENLHVVGTSQFSEDGLKAILKDIDRKKVYIVDLRQESHLFIDKHAVSVYAERDWGNVGLNPKEVEKVQLMLKKNLLNAGNVFIFKDKLAGMPELLEVKNVRSEREVARSLSVRYKRFYVTDHVKPTDEIVDEFVKFVNQLPSDSWTIYHCLAGKGRTTTFMTMVDIMHNADKVSFLDIIERQWLLGGLRLNDNQDEEREDWKGPYLEERYQFLQTFYSYCLENPKFKKSWSQWLKETDRQVPSLPLEM